MTEPFLGKAWTTYMGTLIRVLNISQGDVVELGAGPFSTPLLHWVCKDMHRKLISLENNPEYFLFAKQFRSYFHSTIFVKDWDKIDSKTHRGLVFVDHRPEARRPIEAIRFNNSAYYVVIHDTENEKYYSEVWKNFKYVYTWKGCRPWTSVVSNNKDLNFLTL